MARLSNEYRSGLRMLDQNNASKVAIVGAGIGGLSAALSLVRSGFDVDVYEQASCLTEAGAGIVISPNATRILERLGVAEDLVCRGVRPLAWRTRRWDDGRMLAQTPLAGAVEAVFAAPLYQMHRADLISILAGALLPGRLHLGCRFDTFVEYGNRVDIRFENGSHTSADVLIGADGIHSAVRDAMFGHSNPRFTGCVAYRGLVSADRLKHLDLDLSAQLWLGPSKHFVHYFVAGRRLLNFVAILERNSWCRESWSDKGDIADALAAFEGWHPQVRQIIEAANETFLWALFDHPPLPQWSLGRVALLGDACHPMLPFMAQGAAQAIEDGATLAACLSRSKGLGIPEALALYATLRLPRASRIQSMATANKVRFHLPDGKLQKIRDAQLIADANAWPTTLTKWLYAHDAALLCYVNIDRSITAAYW